MCLLLPNLGIESLPKRTEILLTWHPNVGQNLDYIWPASNNISSFGLKTYKNVPDYQIVDLAGAFLCIIQTETHDMRIIFYFLMGHLVDPPSIECKFL